MDTTLKVLNYSLPLSIYRAEVVHSDKFSRTTGGAFDFPVQNSVYYDVVFRIPELAEDYPLCIKGDQAILYPGKDVSLLVLQNNIVAYVDQKTSYYYYITTDFALMLQLGIHYKWVWVLSIAVSVGGYFLLPEPEQATAMVVCVIVLWLLYFLQKFIINVSIQRSIDRYMRQDK